ncbi:MAG: hypothetical protein FJX59_16075 [Alphaproteobacteria bacterium]|nr:hypothetical protein [Alphaproteobacteria bacterium]
MTTLIDAARALAPDLGPRAAKAYADGRIGEETFAALAKAGLLDPFRDADLSAARLLDVPRALAQHCASTAWLVMAAALGSAGLKALGPNAGALGPNAKTIRSANGLAIWADRADSATLTPDGAGFRLAGTWRAVPGAAQAVWFLLRIDAARAVAVAVPSATVTLNDHQAGLRGATLGDVVAKDVAVPATHVLPIPDALSRLAAVAPLGVVLGVAEGGYREYVASTKKRMAAVGGAAVARMPQVQVRLAETEAELDVARTLFAGVIENALGAPRANLGRDAAFIARQCFRALTVLVQQMGAVGLLETNVVQRHARDLRAAVADLRLGWDANMAARGRAVLGVPETDTGTETIAV